MGLYEIDPAHTSTHFSVKHMMISKVRGSFENITGTFTFDPNNLEASHIEVQIPVTSIKTGDSQRDNHLISPDFFDAEKFPRMTFKSTSLVAIQDGLMVTGELTIHGVKNSVSLELEGPSTEMKDPWGNTRIGFSGTTKINRKDFGLTWNTALEAGGFLVGDQVQIEVDVELIKKN